jgi:hypothetical protein
LAAVRRVAYEAADAGLLSPELAAGIHRVKGVRRLGSVSATGSPRNRVDGCWNTQGPPRFEERATTQCWRC